MCTVTARSSGVCVSSAKLPNVTEHEPSPLLLLLSPRPPLVPLSEGDVAAAGSPETHTSASRESRATRDDEGCCPDGGPPSGAGRLCSMPAADDCAPSCVPSWAPSWTIAERSPAAACMHARHLIRRTCEAACMHIDRCMLDQARSYYVVSCHQRPSAAIGGAHRELDEHRRRNEHALTCDQSKHHRCQYRGQYQSMTLVTNH